MKTQHKIKPGDILIAPDFIWLSETILQKGMGAFLTPKYPYIESMAINTLSILTEIIVIHESLHTIADSHDPVTAFDGRLNLKPLTVDSDAFLFYYNDAKRKGAIDRLVKDFQSTGVEMGSRMNKSELEIIIFHYIASKMAEVCAYTNGMAFRNALTSNDLRRSNLSSTGNESAYVEAAVAVLSRTADVVNEKISARDKYLREYFTLDIPLIFNYVLEKVRSKKDLVQVALEVRETKEARAFRKQLAQLDLATSIGDDKAVEEIIDELDEKIKSLSNKLEQPTIDLDVAFPLSSAINIGQLAKLIQNKIVQERKRHLIFIDQLHNAGKRSRTYRRSLGKLL